MKFNSLRRNKASEDAAQSSEHSFQEDEAARDKPAVESEAPALEQAPPSTTIATTTTTTAPEKVEEATYKFGIADRLNHVVERAPEVDSAKRSPDLVPLTKQFEDMRKKLRGMLATAKRYHSSLQTLDQDRLQMAEELAYFAQNSPVHSQVSDREQSQSYLSIYNQVSHQVHKFSDKFERDVLEYCVEWEHVVTTRVDRELAEITTLRESYNHYQAKVDGLRRNVNKQESKGKTIKDDQVEKLKRNEDKLDEASAEYEAAATSLCCLIEEVVDAAWKDLVPLLQTVMTWEADRSHKEAKLFQQLRGLGLLGGNAPSSSDNHHKHKSKPSSTSKSSARQSSSKRRSPGKVPMRTSSSESEERPLSTPKLEEENAAGVPKEEYGDSGIRVTSEEAPVEDAFVVNNEEDEDEEEKVEEEEPTGPRKTDVV